MTQDRIDELTRHREALDALELAYREARRDLANRIEALRDACDHVDVDGASAKHAGFLDTTCLICNNLV